MKTPQTPAGLCNRIACQKPFRNFLFFPLPVLLLLVIQSCHPNDCAKNFVKKYESNHRSVYQSDSLAVSLKNNTSDSLTFWTFRTNNSDFKLVFYSSSYQVHFSGINGDSVLVIKYGSITKDTLKPQTAQGEKKPGDKFRATAAFVIEPALAADILATRKNNQVNFVLGSYTFDLTDNMACTLEQMLQSKL